MAARDPEGRVLPAIALPLPLVDDAQSGAFGLMGVLVPLFRAPFTWSHRRQRRRLR